MTITGVNYDVSVDSLEFSVRVGGDTASDAPETGWARPRLPSTATAATTPAAAPTVDSRRLSASIPPLNISEFGDGDRVVIDFPLYKKGRLRRHQLP